MPLFYHIRTYNSNKIYFPAKAAALLCQLDFIIVILGTCAANTIRIYYGYNPTQQLRLWQFEPVYWNLFIGTCLFEKFEKFEGRTL